MGLFRVPEQAFYFVVHFIHPGDEALPRNRLHFSWFWRILDAKPRKRKMEISKKVKHRLRALAGIAYERELRAALKPVEQALADMHSGKRDAFAVTEAIHQFHQKPARELWVRYDQMEPEFSIATALLDNVISREEIPAEVRQWFIERAELLRKVRSSDAVENDARDEEETA
jgi:hypothetical protein